MIESQNYNSGNKKDHNSELLLKIINGALIEEQINNDKELYVDENWKINADDSKRLITDENSELKANTSRGLNRILAEKQWEEFCTNHNIILKSYTTKFSKK